MKAEKFSEPPKRLKKYEELNDQLKEVQDELEKLKVEDRVGESEGGSCVVEHFEF